VRLRKGSIRSRVKSDLPIVFTEEKLSSYGGIELFRRFLDRSGFSDRLRRVFSIRQFDGDYGSFRVTLALIGMLLIASTNRKARTMLDQGEILGTPEAAFHSLSDYPFEAHYIEVDGQGDRPARSAKRGEG
jgi:hypothetical protein